MNKEIKQWETEFYKKFGARLYLFQEEIGGYTSCGGVIKQFIQKELDKQREEIYKKLKVEEWDGKDEFTGLQDVDVD